MSALSLTLDTPDLAEHYERVSSERQLVAGKHLIAKLGIARGARVLDVGSGTGLLAAHVAELVGDAGQVVGIDPLPLRVEIASRKARPNLRFEVGDARELRAIDSESFDVAYLNAVFHWLPEKLGALQELARVLKPAGKLGISTGQKGGNTVRAIRRRVLSREPFASQVSADDDVAYNVTAGELAQLLEQSGFTISSLVVEPHHSLHASASAAIDFAQASSFGNYLGRLPEALRATARTQIEAELEALRTERGIPQSGARIVAIAVKA
jgi:ubiquinone/menaquinone biosynthesis C-methylase UbiE